MSIVEALKGAQVELALLQSPSARFYRVLRIGAIMLDAVLGTIMLAPYGFRAVRTYRKLPEHSEHSQRRQSKKGRVSIVRDVRYGTAPRCLLDVYVPAEASATTRTRSDIRPGGPRGQEGEAVPVVLFCHGGVWATGEKWHYAPLGSRLAEAGVLTVVLQYSLYPQALLPQMLAELSAALSWTFNHAASYGGDPHKVSLVGHSAGAQMCAMVLLHRAVAARKLRQQRGPRMAREDTAAELSGRWPGQVGGGGDNGGSGAGVNGAPAESGVEDAMCGAFDDPRMPARFVGMAGVYDIGKHYEYEAGRGVEELSTMKRAVGGFDKFASQSPAVLLGRALRGASKGGQGGPTIGEVAAAAGLRSSFYSSFPLAGEGIAHRTGFERPLCPTATAVCPPSEACDRRMTQEGDLEVALEDARQLPPCVLMSSCTDLTVPWYESGEMFWLLHDAGVPAKHLLYNKLDHTLFALGWYPRPHGMGKEGLDLGEDLPDCTRDLLLLVSEAVPVQYSHPTAVADQQASLPPLNAESHTASPAGDMHRVAGVFASDQPASQC